MSKLDTAVSALMRETARKVILPRYQQLAAHEVTDKAVDDMVTIADTEAEAMLAEGLAKLLPEAAIVGEEGTHADPALAERLGDTLCWIIDPVDGTNNFASGHPPFGIIIALAEAGEAIAGWIYDPLSDRLCSTGVGSGSYINGQRITARTTGQEPPVLASSSLFLTEAQAAIRETYIAPHYTVVAIPRCAAEQYPRLVLGINDLSSFQRTYAWDHAAGALFVNEAGGKVARLDGSPYRVDEHGKPGLLAAASPALFDAFAARIMAIPRG
ncbi:inositol monophosphatase family protein [Novosphingobium sp. Chol11]|uniref:inositol monophosphatase family protein n=1 Tax=Novosphingobium sp. Chol11 TaxID=1385763 RepID=UPI0025FE9B33|nr:inositol monophosphatase family protein [Novosphingobium sp. Chol11]